MAYRKIAVLAAILVLVLIAAKYASPTLAPDIGTPEFLAKEGEVGDRYRAKEPAGRLVEQRLEVPQRWSRKELERKKLYLPQGFKINVFASGLGHARFMAFDSEDNLYLSRPKEGRISVIPDHDGDGVGDRVVTFEEGLDLPHGQRFSQGWLYVAETGRIVRLKDRDGDLEAEEREVVTTAIPGGGMHYTRTLTFGPEKKIYLSVGSSCNVCEDQAKRGVVLQFNRDGSQGKVFARGLRNSVGLVWQEGRLWGTDNGRDWLGENLPPDELNVIREGGHYGWPYCYGERVPDPKFDNASLCEDTVAPRVSFQAHSAPLGLRFYTGESFPQRYRGDLFVAFHGSWNREVPTGYKVVRVKMDGEPGVENFARGWMVEGEKWGRPVDVIFGKGSMFISDDYQGVVYRVSYEGEPQD